MFDLSGGRRGGLKRPRRELLYLLSEHYDKITRMLPELPPEKAARYRLARERLWRRRTELL